MAGRHQRRAGFTLIELMIGVALIAIIVTLAAPSFRDMILMQRLRGINAQLVTDMNFARSEAISRGAFIQVQFQANSSQSCYIIFARTDPTTNDTCDCTAAEGARCLAASTTTEVRTVQLPNSESVFLAVPAFSPDRYQIDPRTGGALVIPTDGIFFAPGEFIVDAFVNGVSDPRKFRDKVGPSGRPSVCAPTGSIVGGQAC